MYILTPHREGVPMVDWPLRRFHLDAPQNDFERARAKKSLSSMSLSSKSLQTVLAYNAAGYAEERKKTTTGEIEE